MSKKCGSSHVCAKGPLKSVTVQTDPLPDLAPLQRLQPLAGDIASHSGSRPAQVDVPVSLAGYAESSAGALLQHLMQRVYSIETTLGASPAVPGSVVLQALEGRISDVEGFTGAILDESHLGHSLCDRIAVLENTVQVQDDADMRSAGE